MTKEDKVQKAKEFLKGYKETITRMDNLNMQIEELRMAQYGTAIQYSDMPKAHNITDLSDYAAKVDKLYREWDAERNCALLQLEVIVNVIQKIKSEEEKNILIMRYIKRLKWEDMLNPLNMSWMTMHRLHSKALCNVYDLLPYQKDDIV